jgi:hypothetical protein
MSDTKMIDLNEARTSFESKVLSGRERGYECREMFHVSKIDTDPETAVVLIPRDIYSVNTSFFLGLFGDSVRALGREKFREKYSFECDDIHRPTIIDGIDRALKEATIFTGRDSA